MKIFVAILLLLTCCASSVIAAVVHGTVYDKSYNLVDSIIIEVNSSPIQRFVSKSSTYSFHLIEGSYQLTAQYDLSDGRVAYAREMILIDKDGYYLLDLFLNESIPLNNSDLDQSVFSLSAIWWIIGLVIIIASLFVIIIFLLKKKSNKELEKPIKSEKTIKTEKKEDSELEQLISIVKKNGGRTTQLTIRRDMPYSEAKISLMISDLESQGKIKKIKKGRANLIILNK